MTGPEKEQRTAKSKERIITSGNDSLGAMPEPDTLGPHTLELDGLELDSLEPDSLELNSAELKIWEGLLSRALRPVEPPPGFAETVLRRTQAEGGERSPDFQTHDASPARPTQLAGTLRSRWQSMRAAVLAWQGFSEAWGAGALAAAALALAVFAGEQTHVRRIQEREQEQARILEQRRAVANQQFDASVRILDRTLEHTREQLRRAGVDGLE